MKLRAKVELVDNDGVIDACKEIMQAYGEITGITTASNYIVELEDNTIAGLCNTYHDMATELEAWFATVYAFKRS